jgi:hypothetical protein
MKFGVLLLMMLTIITSIAGQKKQPDTVSSLPLSFLINSQWTFNYFPADTSGRGFEYPGFNDSKWEAVSLPHTWTSYETTGELKPFSKSPGETGETYWWTGWGWYRRHFTLNEAFSGKKIFLEFEGIQKYCKVWVNGKPAGDHMGGYCSFDLDITDLVKPGRDNVIAVAVSYLQKDEFRLHPASEGNNTASCGITRNVRLVIRNRLYIPMQGSSSHEGGAAFTTSEVNEKEAVYCLTTWVKNDFAEPKSCTVLTTLSDSKRAAIQVIRSDAVINPGQTFMFIQRSKQVAKPHQWSPGDPYLYNVKIDILDRKELTDTYSFSVGFRNISRDRNTGGLIINNARIPLAGCQWRQQAPWLGDAIPDWMVRKYIESASGNKKSNFIRTLDYPASGWFYDRADSLGLLVEEDFSGAGSHGYSGDEQKLMATGMIRRDRNHPSVVAWNLGGDTSVTKKIYPVREDTLRDFFGIKADIIPGCGSCMTSHPSEDAGNAASAGGEPAALIVSASHGSIAADRGSVVMVKVYAADRKGNQVTGFKNTIRWEVTGPGKLVGPANFISYSDSSNVAEGLYTELPAMNLIRSSGVPGKITVSVFAAGVASGSAEIEALGKEIESKVITEPVLANEGRKKVTRSILLTRRIDETPGEIKPSEVDLRPGEQNKSWYSSYIKKLIVKNNPGVDTTCIELTSLSDLLTSQLILNDGIMSASDFNYNAEHFNTCRLIAGYISRTKLPAIFRESLRRYYSGMIITKGNEMNAGDEMDWLNWIPSGGVVVIVPAENSRTMQKGVIYAKDTSLNSIIKTVYPQFGNFSEDGRERALLLIDRMNPAVHSAVSRGNDGKPVTVFTAERGEPVLVPEFKFISE